MRVVETTCLFKLRKYRINPRGKGGGGQEPGWLSYGWEKEPVILSF